MAWSIRRQSRFSRSNNPESFRANVLWEKAAIVDADFLCHEIVQQLIHPQNRRPVLLRLKDQVVHFLGVALQIEKLNVIVPEDFLQRLRRVECARRVVARELVASIKDEGEKAALVQLHLRHWRLGLMHGERGHDFGEVIAINSAHADVVEKNAGPAQP